jgi:hypothetical protein
MDDHQLNDIKQTITQSEERLESKLNDLRNELKNELQQILQYLQSMNNQDVIQNSQIEQRLADIQNRVP